MKNGRNVDALARHPQVRTAQGPRPRQIRVRQGLALVAIEEDDVAGYTCTLLTEELVTSAADGENAAGVIHERTRVKSTGLEFEIEFIQWLTVGNGKIVRWKSYTDPSPIIKATRGDAS